MYLVNNSSRTKGLKVPTTSGAVSRFFRSLADYLCPLQMCSFVYI